MKSMLLAGLVLTGLVAAPPVAAACRLALALGLDVSGSVDNREYRLQMDGIVTALSDPEIERAILATPEVPVALGVYEWSSSAYQRVIVNWRLVDSEKALTQIKAELAGWGRSVAPEATGLGAAMVFGHSFLAAAPQCWDQTLDISGDGKNNDWPLPERLKASGDIAGMRINALVIASGALTAEGGHDGGIADLTAYFQNRVIQGPGAFIEVALGFDDYADAMRRKLLRELATLPLGSLPDLPRDQASLRSNQ